MEKDGSPHRHRPEQPRRKKVPAADFSHRMAPSTCGLESHRDLCQNIKSNADQGMVANRMMPSMLGYEAHRDLYHDTDIFDDDEISGRNLLPIRTGREMQQNLQGEAGISDQYTNSQNLAARLWENETRHQSYYFPLRDSDDMVTSQVCAPAQKNWAREFGQQFDVVQNRPSDDLKEKMSRFDTMVKTAANEKDFSDPAHANEEETRSLPIDRTPKCTLDKRILSLNNVHVENKSEIISDDGHAFYRTEPLQQKTFIAAVPDAVKDRQGELNQTCAKALAENERAGNVLAPQGRGVGNRGMGIHPPPQSPPPCPSMSR
jgi:hypothetical protein